MATVKRVLVYGGSGALGNAIVQHFKTKNYVRLTLYSKIVDQLFYFFFFYQWIASIDVRSNEAANENILVDVNQDWQTQANSVTEKVKDILNNEKFDGIFNVAGGWAGGNASSNGK